MMKKNLFIFLLLACFLPVCAQKKSIGIAYSYLTDTRHSGIGINTGFNIKRHLKLLPDFTYYSKKDMTQFFNGNVNLGYSVNFPGGFYIMPYAGIGILHIYTKGNIYHPGGDKMPTRVLVGRMTIFRPGG